MSSIFLIPILKTAVLPFVLAFIAVFTLGKWWKPESEHRDWITGLGLLIGYLAGFWSITGLNRFPPVQITHWLPYTALFLFPVLLFITHRSEKIRILATIIVIAALLWLHLEPRFQAWSLSESLFWLTGLGIAWLLLWAIWSHAVAPGEGREIPLAMVMAATGVSLVCLYGSAKMSQLSGVLGSASGGIFLARLVVPRIRIGTVTKGLFLVLFGGLMVHALIYAEIAPIALTLVYLTGFSALIFKLPFLKDKHWILSAVLLVVLTGIIIAGSMIYLDAITVEEDYGY